MRPYAGTRGDEMTTAVTDITHRPMSELRHMRLYRLKPNNSRRVDTHGWRSWESYQDGMTAEEYMELGNDGGGQRRRRLTWDLRHGRVELRDA